MKKTALIVLIVSSIFAVLGCNTVQGIGKDIGRGGKAIENAAK